MTLTRLSKSNTLAFNVIINPITIKNKEKKKNQKDTIIIVCKEKQRQIERLSINPLSHPIHPLPITFATFKRTMSKHQPSAPVLSSKDHENKMDISTSIVNCWSSTVRKK